MDSELDSLEKRLDFFRKIELMINKQASGYEIAYEIEKQIDNLKDLENWTPSTVFDDLKLKVDWD